MRLFRDTASSSDSIDLSMEALFGPGRPEKGTTAIHLYENTLYPCSKFIGQFIFTLRLAKIGDTKKYR